MTRTITNATITTTAILLATALPAAAQNFECGKARNASERTICASPILSDLDERLGTAYGNARSARSASRSERQLVRSQRAWLKKRNRCGSSRVCLYRSYVNRIAVLGSKADTVATVRKTVATKSRKRGGLQACNIRGYSIDTDRQGLNVRAAPTTRSAVLGRLRRANDDGNWILPEMEIVGAKGAWLKIRTARQGIDGRTLFDGTGWVHASRVATSTRGYSKGHVKLQNRRSIAASTIARLPADTEVSLLGCRGQWAQVAYNGKRGWLAPGRHCGTAATSCN